MGGGNASAGALITAACVGWAVGDVLGRYMAWRENEEHNRKQIEKHVRIHNEPMPTYPPWS